jgi:hypothetical protein
VTLCKSEEPDDCCWPCDCFCPESWSVIFPRNPDMVEVCVNGVVDLRKEDDYLERGYADV